MTEQEKMLAGLPYDPMDSELIKGRKKAKLVCFQFNQTPPNQARRRKELLSDLLNHQGKFYIEPDFYCDYGYNITLGHNFYSNHHLTILDVCKVSIGDHVFIGPHVMISTATHPVDPVERRSTEYGAPITIGNDCWIGGNVSILAGVIIGDNCTIGAGSVVNKDIPSNSVAVGNPCRVVKTLE